MNLVDIPCPHCKKDICCVQTARGYLAYDSQCPKCAKPIRIVRANMRLDILKPEPAGPKTTDYCRKCGCSPQAGEHTPGFRDSHVFEDPRTG